MKCIDEQQYNLLVEAREQGVESAYSLSEKWKPVEPFLYVSKHMYIYCSSGTKEVPWMWSVNEQGLFEIRLYENAKNNRAKRAAQKRADGHNDVFNKILIPVSVGIITTVIGGLILSIINHFLAPL